MENVCLICKNAIAEGEETFACPECGKIYHAKCWKMTGCCADAECREKTNAKKEAERKEKALAEKKAAEEKAEAEKAEAEKAAAKKAPEKAEAAVPQAKTEAADDKKKEKKRNRIIIIAAIILAYTVIVSAISIECYKSYLAKEIEEAFTVDESDFDSSSGDAEKDNKKKEKASEKISVGQSATVDGMFEFTIEKSEWKEKIEPSDTSSGYSYIDDTEGEKYFVVWAKVKNISSGEIDLSYINGKCSAFINGKYNLDGVIKIEEPDGTGFYGNIKPLQTSRVAFYVSVPDEMYDSFETAEMYLSFVNNEEAVDNYSAEDDDYDNFVLALKNG